uniref:Uncharacterized protein n=1 Tax=Oryza rufipogon TaxID=4529 RepID=A0A0E0NF42_ORYRU
MDLPHRGEGSGARAWPAGLQ